MQYHPWYIFGYNTDIFRTMIYTDIYRTAHAAGTTFDLNMAFGAILPFCQYINQSKTSALGKKR